jgi:hypothetical protein
MAAPPVPAAQALLGCAGRPPHRQRAGGGGRIGRSTATKLLATLATQGQVLRQPGGLTDGRRTADRWTLPTPASTKDPEASSSVTSAAATEQPLTGSGRLRPGALRDLVLVCPAERPGQALSPTTIAKILDRSAGAVANALRALPARARWR